MKYSLLLISLLSALIAFPAQTSHAKQIQSLTTADNTNLERQRSIVNRIIRENFGYVRLEGSTTDLYYLQKTLDKQLIPKSDAYDLQALGVILGDVMVRNLGLRWVIVSDRYGRSRALQFEDTNSLFFPITMISRRVKTGMPLNIRSLYKETEAKVKGLIYERSKYQPLPKPKKEAL